MSVVGPLPLRVVAPLRAVNATRPISQRRRISQSSRPQSNRPDATTRRQRNGASIRCFHSSPSRLAIPDPYKTLGVDKSASASEIKKSYYSKAKQFHPDTNKDPGAKEQFNKAQAAYEILSDKEKRAAYDSYGSSAFDSSGGFNPNAGAGAGPGGNPFGGGGSPFGGFGGFGGAQDINFEDLFGAFTGGRRGRGGGGGGGGGRRNPFQEEILVGDNIEIQTNISFLDAAKGVKKEITINPLVECTTCTGSGLKAGAKRADCKSCGGTGQRVTSMGGFHMSATCASCGGSGFAIPRGSSCNTCSGDGAVKQRKTISIDIPGGVEDGMRMRVNSEGDAPLTGHAMSQGTIRGQKGDLYVLIRVATDRNFKRNGSDILHTATLPLTTAILGGEIKVPTLEGEVMVKVPTGSGTGDHVTLSGMGMKQLAPARRNAKGDLRVEFRVAMPKYLSVNQRTILEMLADEMGDKSAKRVIHPGKMKEEVERERARVKEGVRESHEGEGFLKSAWHNLTGQHRHLDEEGKGSGKEDEGEGEKKKGGGSG